MIRARVARPRSVLGAVIPATQASSKEKTADVRVAVSSVLIGPMTVPDGPSRVTDAELYRRGAETLLACWDAIARGSRRAAVLRLPGVAAAVFPAGPERA